MRQEFRTQLDAYTDDYVKRSKETDRYVRFPDEVIASSHPPKRSVEPARIRKSFASDLAQRRFKEPITGRQALPPEPRGGKGRIAEPVVKKSDAKDKEAIERLLTLPDGLRIYAFRYKNETAMRGGGIAQDFLTEPRRARAVIVGPHREFSVDYARLGVLPATLEAWTMQGRRAVSPLLE